MVHLAMHLKQIKYCFQGRFFLWAFSIFPLYTREGPAPRALNKIKKIVEILGPKSRVEKKLVPNLHFWAKCFSHFDDLQSNLFFPRSVRIDFSRSVIFNLFRRVLPEEIRFFARNLIEFFLRPFFPTEKRQNHSKIDVLQIARNSRTLWWKIIKFYTQNMPRKKKSAAKTPRNCIF